jgi:multiple sugar transport system substrate-binding protein
MCRASGSAYRVTAAIVAVLLALLAGGGVASVSQAAGVTTLTFLGPNFDEWQAFVAVANKLGKDLGIQVKPEYLPWDDVFQKALLDSKTGVRTWDLVYVYNTWVPGLAASKVVVPINDFLTTSQNKALVNPGDFIGETTRGLEYRGMLYAMPMLAAPFMLGYRTDLFNNPAERRAFQAKYGYPLGVPQTYKQLMDIAQFFTRKQGDLLAGKRLDHNFYGIILANKSGGFLFHRFEQVLVAYGADLIYDPKTMRPTINSPQSIAAAKYYVQLHRYMQPGTETQSGGGAERVMADDRGAMEIDALDNMLSVLPSPKVSKIVGQVGYALLPTEDPARPHANVADANGLGIYALTTHRDEAFRLATRVLSAAGVKEIMKEYPALVPMRRSVIDDPEVRQDYPNVFAAMNHMITGKPYTVFVPPLKEWNQAQDIVEAAMSAAMAGQQSVEDALNGAQAKLVDLFRRAGYIK